MDVYVLLVPQMPKPCSVALVMAVFIALQEGHSERGTEIGA